MKRFSKYSILLLFITSLSYSQNFEQVHKLTSEGIDAIYNIDFSKALSKFQEAKSIAPNDLRGSFFEASVYFWKGMLNKSKADYETYLDLSNKFIDRCEDIVDKNENDLDARFYLGWSYTQRAYIIYYIDQSYLKAASDIKDGQKALQFVVEKNPNYNDAYLGLGVYNYIISFVPKKLQFITSMLGFEGNRDEGKRMLRLAADKGTYTTGEAKFYMTLLSWREEDYPTAENYSGQLRTKYPESPAVWMLHGALLQQQDKMQESIEAFNKSIELNKDTKTDIVYKAGYGALASAYFRMNNFEQSAEYGKKYLAYVAPDDNRNNRLYSIGVSLELLGKRDEAMTYYNQKRTDFKEDNGWERNNLRRINERIATPLTPLDSFLIAADNNRAVGKLKEALDDYTNADLKFNQALNPDVTIQIKHGTAQVYFKQKDYDKAIQVWQLNTGLKPQKEIWLVPEAYFQIGRCYLRKGNKSEAQKYFDMALDIDYDYDFKDNMEGKIKNELTKF